MAILTTTITIQFPEDDSGSVGFSRRERSRAKRAPSVSVTTSVRIEGLLDMSSSTSKGAKPQRSEDPASSAEQRDADVQRPKGKKRSKRAADKHCNASAQADQQPTPAALEVRQRKHRMDDFAMKMEQHLHEQRRHIKSQTMLCRTKTVFASLVTAHVFEEPQGAYFESMPCGTWSRS